MVTLTWYMLHASWWCWMILTAVLTCVVYHFIALVYRRHKKVSVIIVLIQNTCVILAGSVELLDDDLLMNPMLLFYSQLYFIEKEKKEKRWKKTGSIGNGECEIWWVLIPHVSLCKWVTDHLLISSDLSQGYWLTPRQMISLWLKSSNLIVPESQSLARRGTRVADLLNNII